MSGSKGGEAVTENHKTCKECGKDIFADDIAIHRKLINRGAQEFFCIDCLAEKLGCEREYILRLIEFYRSTGKCCENRPDKNMIITVISAHPLSESLICPQRRLHFRQGSGLWGGYSF